MLMSPRHQTTELARIRVRIPLARLPSRSVRRYSASIMIRSRADEGAKLVFMAAVVGDLLRAVVPEVAAALSTLRPSSRCPLSLSATTEASGWAMRLFGCPCVELTAGGRGSSI